MSKEQLLFSFLCIVKQKKISERSEIFWIFLFLKIYFIKKVWKGGFQLMLILGLLGMYFDAAVVFVTSQTLLLRLALAKEYIERRHGEPFKFLFLPKMGLLGSQAVLEKKVQFWIMSNFLAPFFQLFMGKKLFFKLFFYIAASALKSCLIKKFKKLKKNIGRIFFGLKTVFFRASCFGLFWF